MIPLVGNLITRTQALLDDPTGKWADHDYLMPFVEQVNEDLYTELAAINLTYADTVVVLQAVAANTSDLSAYQATGGLLEYMMVPTLVEWREVGESDLEWKPVTRLDKVADTSAAGDGQATASVSSFVNSYEWRASILYISPCDQPVDLRIRFQALPVVLTDDEQTLIRGLINVMAYRVAELVAEIRGNMGNLAAQMKVRGDTAAENFEILMVKQSQLVRRRFGRANRGQTSQLSGPAFPFFVGS